MERKDNKGRILKTGEGQRKDGRYFYRYSDDLTNERLIVYAKTLQELREKEKEIEQKKCTGLRLIAKKKSPTLNQMFEIYMDTKELRPTTIRDYNATWKNHVQKELGEMKVVDIKAAHIRTLFSKLSKEGYSHNMIRNVVRLIKPCFDLAVESDVILKNPVPRLPRNLGIPQVEKTILTQEQQRKLLEFVKNDNFLKKRYPMLVIMLGLCIRCGELVGLSWRDIDFENNTVTIDSGLTYMNFGNGFEFKIAKPKTKAGNRKIPMAEEVKEAFKAQKKYNFEHGLKSSCVIDGKFGFIFVTKNGTPYSPTFVNVILKSIVNKYNEKERKAAKKEQRRPNILPHLSPHSMRHTGCTRMAENNISPKVMQYVMGHSSSQITLDVYTHVNDCKLIQREMEKMTVCI